MHDYNQRYLAMVEEGSIKGLPEDGIYVAMVFLFTNPGVHTAIVGTKNPDHIRANVRMFEDGLSMPESQVE